MSLDSYGIYSPSKHITFLFGESVNGFLPSPTQKEVLGPRPSSDINTFQSVFFFPFRDHPPLFIRELRFYFLFMEKQSLTSLDESPQKKRRETTVPLPCRPRLINSLNVSLGPVGTGTVSGTEKRLVHMTNSKDVLIFSSGAGSPELSCCLLFTLWSFPPSSRAKSRWTHRILTLKRVGEA